MFKALPLEYAAALSVSVQSFDDARLPAGDVTVSVACSTLNYKEGLAITQAQALMEGKVSGRVVVRVV